MDCDSFSAAVEEAIGHLPPVPMSIRDRVHRLKSALLGTASLSVGKSKARRYTKPWSTRELRESIKREALCVERSETALLNKERPVGLHNENSHNFVLLERQFLGSFCQLYFAHSCASYKDSMHVNIVQHSIEKCHLKKLKISRLMKIPYLLSSLFAFHTCIGKHR